MQWRERFFFNLSILTFMAIVAALVGVVSWIARIEVLRPAALSLLAVGAIVILRVAPAIDAKFTKWAGQTSKRR